MTTIAVFLIVLVSGSAALWPAGAMATDCVSGTIAVGPSDKPALGQYAYTISISWGPLQFGLSHWDMWLGQMECSAICDGINPFAFADTAGTSTGSHDGDGCTVHYAGALRCDGDPSLHFPGPLFKFDPLDGAQCLPGKSGTGQFVFYSNWSPGPQDTIPNVLIVKYGSRPPCQGTLIGRFPTCGGIPAATQSTSWGGIKGIYKK